MANAPWMHVAEIFKGEAEIRGAMHNDKIVEMFKLIGQPDFREDEIPWCAAALGACLSLSGYANTKSALARSYLRFGEDLGKNPKYGCIAVFSRGDPASGLGHVGFYTGEAKGKIKLLGGNQNDAFTLEAYPKSRLLAYRWPRRIAALPLTFLPTILDLDEENAPDHLKSITPGQPINGGPSSPFLSRISPSERFLRCHEIIAKWEGGYVDHPEDPGGPTNFGITIKTLSEWRGQHATEADVKALTYAEALDIFAARFWLVIQGDRLPAAAALMTYNAAVNSGPERALRFLQRALTRQGQRLDIDGEMGPQTLAAARSANMTDLVQNYAELYRNYYEALSAFPVFGRGWLNRLAAIKTEALVWAEQSDDARAIDRDSRTGQPARQDEGYSGDRGKDDLTIIDKVFGGRPLVGKKTLIAAIAYIVLVIAEGLGWLPEGFVNQTLTHPSPDAGAPVPGIGGGEPIVDILKTVLLTFAGIGAVSKIERGLKIFGKIAPVLSGAAKA